MRTLVVVVMLAACTPAWKRGPHDRLFQYEVANEPIKKPGALTRSEWWDTGNTLFVRPLALVISPSTYANEIIGGRTAQDINAFGQVPDSTWFHNRIGRYPLPPESAHAGCAIDDGVAEGPLLVVSGKLEGVSAGFVVRDSAKQTWYVKLDHPAFPELSTSAEVIASRLLWLAGYYVPSMHAIDIDTKRLVLDPSARARDRYNRKVPLTQPTFDRLLANTNPDPGGRIRILVSRQPPGEVLGPFSFRGRRLDDKNDRLDHEHRRSLRGLWVFYAWLNNTDTRDANTLDMFRPLAADGRGVIDHYLIDFGDSFGATAEGEKVGVESWEYLLDWREVLVNLVTLGLRTPPYENARRSPFRSVGLFDAGNFDPGHWKPAYPNWAFDQRTRDDTFWAVSILSRISPAHVRSAVAAGVYREVGAADYVTKVLLERRKKLLDYGLHGYLELDRPTIDGTLLRLDDLRSLGGLSPIGPIDYAIRWNRTRRPDRDLSRGTLAPTEHDQVTLDLASAVAIARATAGFAEDPFLSVELARHGGARLIVHVRITGDRIVPVGVER